MRMQVMFSALALGAGLAVAGAAAAVTVDIQGKRLVLDQPGGGCVAIGGDYEGFRIVPTEPGQTPQACAGSGRTNSIRFIDTTFVATDPALGERTVTVEHDFESGPKGLVYGTVKLEGFFAQATGASVPAGNRVTFSGAFAQGGNETPIGEPIDHTVDESLESALLDTASRGEFVLSGPRKLKSVLTFTFTGVGDKLVFERNTAVVLDNVRRQQE